MKKYDVMVVGARLERGEVIAVAPPEATALTQFPDLFETHGDMAVMDVDYQAGKQAGELATTMMLEEADRYHGGAMSRSFGSKALEGVVTVARLTQETTQNLR